MNDKRLGIGRFIACVHIVVSLHEKKNLEAFLDQLCLGPYTMSRLLFNVSLTLTIKNIL